jgi:beta-lactamase regulating signal transducer with metallopeptidase domain
MISLPVVVVWGLKATPLLLLVLLASLCLHRASAAHRHFLWTLGVVAALLMPGVSVLGPAVSVSWLTASFETVSPGPSPTLSPSLTTNATRVTTATDELLPMAENRASRVAEIPPAGRNQAFQSILPSLSYTVWIVGAFVTGLLLLVSLLGTWVVGRRAQRVLSGQLFEDMERARGALGIKRPIRLLLARSETMPMTWGHWHPALLLPVSALSWSAARSRAVLLHELAHVQRSSTGGIRCSGLRLGGCGSNKSLPRTTSSWHREPQRRTTHTTYSKSPRSSVVHRWVVWPPLRWLTALDLAADSWLCSMQRGRALRSGGDRWPSPYW